MRRGRRADRGQELPGFMDRTWPAGGKADGGPLWGLDPGAGRTRRRARPPRGVVRIGLLQFAPQTRSVDANVQFIRSAVRHESDALIVLPELFLGSYRAYPLFFPDERELQSCLAPLAEVSKLQRLHFGGSLPVQVDGRNFNRAVVVTEGDVRYVYDKTQLFDSETHFFRSGRRSTGTIELSGLACTVQICLDILDPGPTRAAVRAGAQLILGPSSVSVDFLRVIHRARALENQVISIFCNRCGTDSDGTQYLGRSAVFFPDGTERSVNADDEALELVPVQEAAFEAMAATRKRLTGDYLQP
jgi:predicted amidohydrolase